MTRLLCLGKIYENSISCVLFPSIHYFNSIIDIVNTQKVYTKVYILSDTFSFQKHKKAL